MKCRNTRLKRERKGVLVAERGFIVAGVRGYWRELVGVLEESR